MRIWIEAQVLEDRLPFRLGHRALVLDEARNRFELGYLGRFSDRGRRLFVVVNAQLALELVHRPVAVRGQLVRAAGQRLGRLLRREAASLIARALGLVLTAAGNFALQAL